MARGIVPKPLSKEETELVDTIRLLAGERICENCNGTGRQEGVFMRELAPGVVIHQSRGKCVWCDGARLLSDKGRYGDD
jgi:hypothetical protein